MALGINDFKDGGLSVEDFEVQPEKKAKLNSRTAAQLAAGQTALSTGSNEEFARVKESLMNPENREMYTLQQEQLRQNIMADSKAGLVNTIADPTLDEETKTKAVIGATQGFGIDYRPSSLQTLAEEALVADASVHETARSAAGRDLMMEGLGRLTEHKRAMTKAINSLDLDRGIANKVVDTAELFAPFAEWIHYDRLLKELTGESQTGLLGEQKKQLFDYLKDRPIEERAEVVQQIIQIVSESDTMVLPDGNDLATLETLEAMLLSGDYSNFDRYFDNVTSVLEVLGGVGSMIRGVARGTKAGSKADKVGTTLQREADEFVSAQKEAQTKTPLEKEAESFATDSEPTAEEVFAKKKKQTEADLKAEAEAFKSEPELNADTVFRDAKTEATRTEVVPTSPSQIVKDTNPELARDMHDMALDDETGEAAEALYGASREEVAAKDILLEPTTRDGVVPNKVEMRTPDNPETIKILQERKKDGGTVLSRQEEARVMERVSRDLDDIEGMVRHNSSAVMKLNQEGTTTFTARYSPRNGGFSSPTDAIEAAKVAFRHYGMGDQNLSILARRGDKWVKASKKELEAEITLREHGADIPDGATEYAIGMEYTTRARSVDLVAEELDNLTTAPGLVARIVQHADGFKKAPLAGTGQGSLVQNLLDAASVIHPRIVNAASVAADRVIGMKKLYVEEFQEFSENYAKLSKDRRAVMTDYIHRANREGLPLNITELASTFNAKEIEILKEWRRANDTMWYAANDDMVVSLSAKGVKVFRHKASDTRLMGYAQPETSAKPNTMFDAAKGSVEKKTTADLEELYAKGGEVVKLTEPTQIDSQWVTHVFSPNTVEGGYVRKLRESEIVLPYREGYYPVMYDANYYIRREITTADGVTVDKTIAAAQDKGEAADFLKEIQKADNLTDEEMKAFTVDLDKRTHRERNSLVDEGAWNVSASGGMSSQRIRGKQLMDAGAGLEKHGKAHLEDPLRAVATQVQQLSQRVAMRNYLDTVKQRWVHQYGEYLELPIDKNTGKPKPPKGVSDIKLKSGAPSKMYRDAKSNYNYIAGLENGYINGMDELYRGILHMTADLVSELGLHKVERAALKGAKYSPVQAGKTAAFKLLISGNPARQAFVQRGQMIQLAPHNPEYFATKLVPDLVGVRLARRGVTTDPKYVELYKEAERSGIFEAVDAHSLIREDLLHLADLSAVEKAKTKAGWLLQKSQEIGFDAAEQDVILSAWLSARDKVHKSYKGKKVDLGSQRIQDEIHGEARAYTLNMNRAGEMPYSQNTLGLAAQFLSFQHKALLQTISNRNLTVAQRGKLMFYTAAVFGIDATLISVAGDAIFGKEPSELKDQVEAGFLDVTLNGALTQMSGEQQNIDFGDLAPTEVFGIGGAFLGALSTNIPEMMSENPAGSLVFGNNPRLRDAFATGFKFFAPWADYEDPALSVTFPDVVHAAMSSFSGYSNAWKARYAYQTGMKMSGSGRITDEDVTKYESVAAAFGFRTKTEEGSRKLAEAVYGNKSGAYQSDAADVDKWVGDLKRHLARRFNSISEEEMAQRVLAEGWRVFGEDRDRVVDLLMGHIKRDAKRGDHKLIMGLIGKMGIHTEDQTWKLINSMPAGRQRDMAVQAMNTRKEMMNGS